MLGESEWLDIRIVPGSRQRAAGFRIAIAFGLLLLTMPEPVFAFWIYVHEVHQLITDDALSAFQFQHGGNTIKFPRSKIIEIIDANAAVDGYQWNPALHFDNENLLEGSQRLFYGKALLLNQLQTASTISVAQAKQLRNLFGGYLHTLQDFYAHTNYVNISPIGAIESGLGDILLPPQRVDANPCRHIAATLLTEPDTVLQAPDGYQVLTSGYAWPPLPAADAPEGQCAHGFPLPHNPVGNGINKDFWLRPFYQEAHDAARTATRVFASLILNDHLNTPDNVCMFMTDSPCPASCVFNTGVDNNGTLLPDQSVDSHYPLVVNPNGSGPNAYVVSAIGFPIGTGDWFAGGPSSKWIAPQSQYYYYSGDVAATFAYQTTFNLTDPATAYLAGQWATDNEGVNILLNGQPTGNTIPAPNGVGFRSFTPFTINTGFVPGLNTLDFLVHNDGGPSGLQVEFTSATCP